MNSLTISREIFVRGPGPRGAETLDYILSRRDKEYSIEKKDNLLYIIHEEVRYIHGIIEGKSFCDDWDTYISNISTGVFNELMRESVVEIDIPYRGDIVVMKFTLIG